MKVNTKTIDILRLFSMIRDGIAPEKFVIKRPDDCRYEFRLKQSGKHVGQYITNVDMTLPAMFCDCSVDDILKSEVIYDYDEFNDTECKLITAIANAFFPDATKFALRENRIEFGNEKKDMLGYIEHWSELQLKDQPFNMQKHGSGWYSITTFDEVK